MSGQYITRRRARFRAICGNVNLPYGTKAQERDGFLFLPDGRRLCVARSKNGDDYFCSDEDDKGRERARLINTILLKLRAEDDEVRDARWAKVWDSELCAKYRRQEHKDFWLWDHSLYCAPVEDLEKIATLVSEV